MAEPRDDPTLLNAVKDALGYGTYDDAERDNRLRDMIRDGKGYLEERACGLALTYAEGSTEWRLLKQYCLYANSQKGQLFEGEYIGELNAFQRACAVEVARHDDDTNGTSD